MSRQMTEHAPKLKEITAQGSIRSDPNPSEMNSSVGDTGNLFRGIPEHLPEELTTSLLCARHVRVERIVSRGHSSPAGFWYDQNQHEWVMLLRGVARLQFDDHLLEMHPGDFVHIAAHQKHRLDWTSPDEQTVWLAVFYDCACGENRRTSIAVPIRGDGQRQTVGHSTSLPV
jgi:cupin 2 domain-containing protein